jgi:D-alanine transaminase
VPAYAGKPFRFHEHMNRLDRSLGELRIVNPMSLEAWRTLVEQLIARYAETIGLSASAADVLVYIQVTRGVAMRDHAMVQGIEPTVFAMVNKITPPTAEERATGFFCVTADDFRWKKAHIKSVSLLGAVLSRQISADAGAVETIMFREGWLSEGASANVWVVKDGRVIGAPKDNLVLEGIRYGVIETVCRDHGIPFELRRVSRDEVFTADELLLSNASKEVLAVTRLDDRTIGNGRPGPIYDTLYQGYQRLKQSSS